MGDFSIPFPFPQQDIFLEILLRLDAKSVTSFKLASKSWYNFLSNPSFSKFYFKFRPSITGFFYRTSQYYAEKIQYVPLHPNQEPITDPPSCLGFLDNPALLFNSCNGLLHWCTSWNQHFISNPLNHKLVPIDWPFFKGEIIASGIAYDPSVSDDFEVVVLLVESPTCLKLKSFSSEKMEWGLEKELSVKDSTIKPYFPNRGVFINGVLYWELENNSLLAYNVKDGIEIFIKLPMRTNLSEKLQLVEDGIETLINFPMRTNLSEKLQLVKPGCLGESKGKLHYCRILGTLLCVWGQKSANSSTWAPLHMIKLIMCGSSSIRPSGNQALAFLDDCKGVLLSTENDIKAYYLEERLVKEVCQVRKNGLPSIDPSMFFPFVHTLALSSFFPYN